jgi:NADPH:quinone reductase-like Zn-dependent oxidoreductase
MTQALKMMAADYGGVDQVRAYEVDAPDPGPGEVTIDVRAAGVNPVDYKVIGGYRGRGDASSLPLPLGSEVAGVIAAIGPDTEIASGGGSVGDPVVAYRVVGGFASALTLPARDVFAKPDALGFPEAANLLLVGTTACDMLRVVRVEEGQTVVIHGASGAVGVNLLQQLRPLGVRAIGTASERNFGEVRRFGGQPVAYGEGLEERLRALAPDGYDAAFDCVGTDEAVDTSLALVPRDRLVTIAAFGRAEPEGFKAVAGAMEESQAFRDSVRADLLARAARGELEVPMARTFPLRDAADALRLLADQHPGGKLALIP